MSKPISELQVIRMMSEMWTRIKGLTNWLGLEFVETNVWENTFNKYDIVENVFMNPTDGVTSSSDVWDVYYKKCQAGDKFTICKREPHDSKYIMWLDENDNYLGFSTLSYPLVNGWLRYRVTVPSNDDIAKYAICIYKPTSNLDEFMIYEGHEEPPIDLIPYGQPKVLGVKIDSDNVSMSFNNNETNLGAITIQGAIKELDDRTAYQFLVAEYKTLSYDQQDSFIFGGRTWLKCDGRGVSKSDYDSLYNILGNTFGESADTFNLPNNQSQGYLYICAK